MRMKMRRVLLTAALAALLPRAAKAPAAARAAKQYVTEAIRQSGSLSVGSGHGPVHHMHPWWGPVADTARAERGATSGTPRDAGR